MRTKIHRSKRKQTVAWLTSRRRRLAALASPTERQVARVNELDAAIQRAEAALAAGKTAKGVPSKSSPNRR
jgi:hypothetical protein